MDIHVCEACGRNENTPPEIPVGMVEIVGVGGHFLCMECMREMNLSDELTPTKVRYRASILMEQTMTGYLSKQAGRDMMHESLERVAREQFAATADHYRACVQWILAHPKSTDEDAEAA